MSDPRVFAHLPQEVLAIDQLQVAPPKALEFQAEAGELRVTLFRQHADDLGLGESGRIAEALADPVARPWTGDSSP